MTVIPGLLATTWTTRSTRSSHTKYHGRQLWDIDLAEYECLVPTLRLASKLLESPASICFLDDVAFAPRETVPGGPSGREWSVFKGTHEQDTEIRPVRRSLWSIAQLIRFLPVDNLSGSWAQCAWTGCMATISIRQSMFNSLKTLMYNLPANDGRVLYSQLFLATILCHEVAHAIDYAFIFRPPTSSWIEPFYRTDRCAELGATWEQQVLGGIVVRPGPVIVAAPASSPPFLHQWPSFGFNEQKSDATRSPPPPNKVEWLLDLRHVEKLQQQAFWNTLRSVADPNVCRFPKLIGLVQCCGESGYGDLHFDANFYRLINLGDARGEYTLREGGHWIVRARSLDQTGPLAKRFSYDLGYYEGPGRCYYTGD